MSKLPAWVRLDMRYYEDEDLDEAADLSGVRLTTYALWPLLICHAKRASSPANVDGTFRTTRRRLAKVLGTNEEEVDAALYALSEAELIACEDDRVNKCRITILGFGKWQTVKGTDADRKAIARANEQAKSGFASGASPGEVTDKSLETGDRREEVPIGTLSDSGKPNPDRAATIRSIYQHWCEQSGNTRRKLTADRRSRINARLADGYTPDEIKQAITNGLRDPFLQGDNPRGRVYDDLSTIIGSAEKLERYRDAATRNPTSASTIAEL